MKPAATTTARHVRLTNATTLIARPPRVQARPRVTFHPTRARQVERAHPARDAYVDSQSGQVQR